MLGDNIKELRHSLKLSQAQFAEKLGVNQENRRKNEYWRKN